MYFPDLLAHGLWLIYGSAVVVLGMVWKFGGQPERYAVYTLLLILVVQLAGLAITGGERFETVDIAFLGADLVGFGGFMLIALNANRTWVLLAAALQLLTLLGHLLQGYSEVVAWAYLTFKTWPTMLIAFSILPIATSLHQLRLQRFGEDRDWVPYKKYREYRKIAKAAHLQGF